MKALGGAALALALGLAQPAAAQHGHGGGSDWPDPHPMETYGLLVFDQLEHRARAGDDELAWDVEGWLGGDTERWVLKSEGERSAAGRSEGEAELQLLWSRSLTPFWDVQLGLRQDARFGSGPNEQRTQLVIGLEGVAPQWIHVEPALFVSDEGDTSLRIEASHELYVTQRWVAQTRVELEGAFSNDRDFAVESGLGDLELELRVRYEARRELAPYVGVTWTQALGQSADLARRLGEDDEELAVVVGVRFWF
jgi:copper resistance protein B